MHQVLYTSYASAHFWCFIQTAACESFGNINHFSLQTYDMRIQGSQWTQTLLLYYPSRLNHGDFMVPAI